MPDDARRAIQPYYDILVALDEGNFEVEGWEDEFIAKLLTFVPSRLSAKEKAIIERMDEQYLQGRD